MYVPVKITMSFQKSLVRLKSKNSGVERTIPVEI